jgi:hypothetical protein
MNFDSIGSAYYGDKKKKKDETPTITPAGGGSVFDRIGSAYYGSKSSAATPEPIKQPSFLDSLIGKVTQGAGMAWDALTHKGFGGTDNSKFSFSGNGAPTGAKLDLTTNFSPSSAQMQVTKPSLDRAKKVVDALSYIPNEFSRIFPETSKLYGEISSDTFSLKADVHKAIPDFVKTIKDSWTAANENQPVTKTLWQLLANTNPLGLSTGQGLPFGNAQEAGQSLQNVSRTIGVPLSIFSAVFSAANDVPLAGTVSKAISLPFVAIGEGAPKLSNKIIDAIPRNILPPEDKEALKPGVGETFALALQLLGGKAMEVGPKKFAQLSRKYGEVDAQTIVTQATKLAEERKQVQQVGKKEPVVVTPDSVRIQVSDLPQTPATQALKQFADQAQKKKKNIEVVLGGGSPEKGLFKGTAPSGVDFTLKMVEQHPAHFAEDGALAKAFAPVTKREVVKLDKAKYQSLESGTLILRPNGTASVDVRFGKEGQGRGQGTKAVAELEQMAKDRGATKMEIAAFTEAQGFWEKQGYKVVPNAKTRSSLLVKMDKTLVIRQKETPSGKISGMNWYRGIDEKNKGAADSFYSTSKSVASDYGKVEKIKTEDLPKNPLEVSSKEELAQTIGYKGDPLAEPKDLPVEKRFDTLAKKYAQSKGHDGIVYLEGSLGEAELHKFGAELVKDDPEVAKALKEAKGLSVDDIIAKHPDLNLKRDVPATDIHGNKIVIPEGEALTPYELKGNKVLLQDGETYIVSKNQYENIKGNSKSAEAKEFAPELKKTQDVVKGVNTMTETDRTDLQKLITDNGMLGFDSVSEAISALREPGGMDNFEFNSPAEKQAIATILAKRGAPSRFSDYQMRGGKNYKEILIKAPSGDDKPYILRQRHGTETEFKNHDEAMKMLESLSPAEKVGASIRPAQGNVDFKSSHWEEPNVISHVRLNEREFNGKKVTFMEELQSDWAREGRARGFMTPEKTAELQKKIKDLKAEKTKFEEKQKEADAWFNKFQEDTKDEFKGQVSLMDLLKKHKQVDKWEQREAIFTEYKRIDQEISDARFQLERGLPNNPLLKNWQELSIKRALLEAVKNDSDYFAWISGDQTTARYKLSTQVESIHWDKNTTGTDKLITINAKDNQHFTLQADEKGVITQAGKLDLVGKKLDEALGKGLADKIMSEQSGKLSGQGLNFGGEWANNLYDKQVKAIVEDLTGAKVESLDLGLPVGEDKPTFTHTQDPNQGLKVLSRDVKPGLMVTDKYGAYWVIVEKTGEGKFKAVNVRQVRNDDVLESDERPTQFPDMEKFKKRLAKQGRTPKEIAKRVYGREQYIKDNAKEFDVSPGKMEVQQGIVLTPDVKALIESKAQALKKPSGKNPFEEETNKKLSPESENFLKMARGRIGEFDEKKVMGYAYKIAEEAKSKEILPQHIAEALQYRPGNEVPNYTRFHQLETPQKDFIEGMGVNPILDRMKSLGVDGVDERLFTLVPQVRAAMAKLSSEQQLLLRHFIDYNKGVGDGGQKIDKISYDELVNISNIIKEAEKNSKGDITTEALIKALGTAQKNKETTVKSLTGDVKNGDKIDVNGKTYTYEKSTDILGKEVEKLLPDKVHEDWLVVKRKDGKITIETIYEGDKPVMTLDAKPAAEPIIAAAPPKEVPVSRDQLPIGEGEEAVSALQNRVTEALKGLSQEQIDELGVTEFNRMNNKDTIRKASEYVIKNPDEALKVLTGEIQPPEGLNSNSIFVAMANNAIGDFKLATKLATLKSTAMGQNIEILKELNVTSPVKIISDVYKVKEAELQKRFAGQSTSAIKKKYVSRGKTQMQPPKLTDWGEIIKSIEC